METTAFQNWVKQFYEKRGWSDYNGFIRVGFLMEEVGEVARVIRALEIGRDRPDEAVRDEDQLRKELKEEIGDVLGNVLILAKLYGLSLEDIMRAHVDKLSSRFADDMPDS